MVVGYSYGMGVWLTDYHGAPNTTPEYVAGCGCQECRRSARFLRMGRKLMEAISVVFETRARETQIAAVVSSWPVLPAWWGR